MIRFRFDIILFSAVLLFLAFPVKAAVKPALKNDTVSLQKLEMPASEIALFKQNKNFRYNKPEAGTTFLQRILMALDEWFGFRILAKTAPWLIYVLLLLAFAILMVVLFRSRFQGIFSSNQHELFSGVSNNEIAENIDFNALIGEAAGKKNYNLAVRYLYLSLLRLLDKKQLISYEAGKTNYEYLNEVTNPDLLPLLRSITRFYEYAWYGKFLLEENDYNMIAVNYKTLTEKIDD